MEKINLLELFIYSVWLMLPAFIANLSPVLIAKLTGEGKPIDMGKSLNQHRILGDSKTFRGFFGGSAVGIVIGLIQIFIAPTINLPVLSWIAIITLPVGTLSGDIIGSFIKRRVNLKPGASFPILDQLDFVFGALLLTLMLDYNWFINNFTIPVIIFIIVLTTIFHFVFNLIGFKLGLSKHPW